MRREGMIECFPIDILRVLGKMALHPVWEVGIISIWHG
jgi:hypothetical protein